MAGATKVGILYSLAQRRRRALVIPDRDDQLPLTPRPGEGYVEQSIEDYLALGPDHAVEQVAGGAPLPDRCALVDAGGIVRGGVQGDPAIDSVPDRVMVPHARAQTGDRYDGARFWAGYALVDAVSGRVVEVGEFDIDGDRPVAPEGQVLLSDRSRSRRVDEVVPEVRDAIRTDPGDAR